MNIILLIGLSIFGLISYLLICVILMGIVADFLDDLVFYWNNSLGQLVIGLGLTLTLTLEVMLPIFIIDLL